MNSWLQSKQSIKSLVSALVVLLLSALLFPLYKNKESLVRSLPTSNPDPIMEFVGKYYMGDGLGLNCSFEIRPDASFNISLLSDTGHKENFKGLISFVAEQFNLEPTNEVETPALCFHRTFIPVYWGGRRYLLPNDDDELSKYIVSTFCRSVKNGDEPRNDVHGVSYLRVADITIEVKGFPLRQDGRLQCPIFAFGQ